MTGKKCEISSGKLDSPVNADAFDWKGPQVAVSSKAEFWENSALDGWSKCFIGIRPAYCEQLKYP